MKLEKLSNLEMTTINGGHNGTIYRIGVAVGETLGIVAVYTEGILNMMGIRDTIKK
jgi:hypothetical protein